MQIAHVFPSRSWGGAEIYALELASRQHQQGWPVIVWGLEGAPIVEEARRRKIPVMTEPVFAFKAISRYPGVTYRIRSSRPSVQYARPRPDNRRGATVALSPSRSPCVQINSPVAASNATTALRDPAVEYRTPPTISGVDSRLNSGRGPRFSVLNRHATSRFLKLAASICFSGE